MTALPFVASPAATNLGFRRGLRLSLSLALLPLLISAASAAEDATLTPNTTTTTATTPLALHVTGLGSAGATVIIERYVDANGNGIIDAGEFLVERFTVTDGQVSTIGGVRNTHVPGDDDGTADSQISLNLIPAHGAEFGQLAGAQLIRISSPTDAFTSFTRSLTLTQPALGQSISGDITTGGSTPLPYASVILLDFAMNDGEFVGGVIADASGHYSINAPAGSYGVLAFKSGYLGAFPENPAMLAAAGSATVDVDLTVATRTISGTVTDVGPTTGLGGVQLFIQSDDGIAITSTDADGTFSVPVTAATWEIEPSEASLAQLGYLSARANADTTAGNASGISIAVPAVTVLIHGTVTDSSDAPLAGLQVFASDNGNSNSGAVTDASGHYTLGVTAGTWYTNISNEDPALAAYVLPAGQQFTLSAGQAQQADFTLLAVNAHLTGTVVNTGTPVAAGIRLGAYNQSTNQFITTETASDGTFDLGLVDGTWMLQLESQNAAENNLIGSSVSFTLGANQITSGITFQVKSSTGQISGQIRDADNGNAPLANANVYAFITVSSVQYNTNFQTDGSGNYSLKVFDGTWSLGAGANGYSNLPQRSVTVSGSVSGQDFNLTKKPVFYGTLTNQTVTASQTFVFSASANSPVTFDYHWQVSTNSGSSWADLANDSTYSNVTSSTLGITANAGLDGYQYRNSATNANGTNYSNAATLTVNVPPAITSHPTNQTITEGDNPTFTVAATGAVSLQWQISTNGGGLWSDLIANSTYSGISTTTLTVTGATLSLNNNQYRAVATNAGGSANSNPALLFVNAAAIAPSITGEPIDQSVTAGQNATFNVSASGTPTPTILWQLSINDGGSWSDLADDATYSGATTGTLTVAGTVVGQNGNRYRAVATNTVNSATSNSALLTVNPANVAPSITGHPTNQMVTAGQNTSFSASADGTPAPSFQWQVSTDGGGNWSNLSDDATYSGTASSTLSITGATIGLNTYHYRVVATNTVNSANSNSALLTVNPANVAPSITADPANQTVTDGQNATFTVAADGTPSPTFQWQVSTDGGSGWSDLSNDSTYNGVTGATLTVTAAGIGQNGNRYRGVATNTVDSANSNSALLTVNPQNYAVLHSFIYATEGGAPFAELISSGGILYGITSWGGSSTYGTVFKINPDGTGYTVLHDFTTGSGEYAGGGARGALVLSGSTLYGTTVNGGTSGYGRVFKVNTDGTGYAVLYDFGFADANPYGGLVLSGSTLYGTTGGGSGPGQGGSSYGTVFAINTDGTGYATVHTFSVPTDSDPTVGTNTDGAHPLAGLTLSGGTLYGVTTSGGDFTGGTVFAVNTNGTGFSVLHHFTNLDGLSTNSDGYRPQGRLLLSGGTLYGTAIRGGAADVGTVFKVDVNGAGFATLHSFTWGNGGGEPRAGLILSGSTLYGTTLNSGSFSYGTIFSLNTDGTDFTIEHAFTGAAAGQTPEAGLVLVNNSLYGVTNSGGTGGYGTVFRLLLGSPAVSFSSWADTYFTPSELLDVNVSGPNAVFGLDGLPNLVKYALGLDPTLDATSGLPVTSTLATDWTYTYTRPTDRSDLTYAVEVSTNLTTWTTAGVTLGQLSSSGGIETWQAKYPLASAANLYFRLKVTQL